MNMEQANITLKHLMLYLKRGMLIFCLKFFNMCIYGRINNNRYEDILE